MHHLFRLRHLLILAVVLGVGLVPLYACHQDLGAAANFAVLADDIETAALGTLDVNAPGAGSGAANVGANTYTPDASGITADGSVLPAGDPAVATALTDAETNANELVALAIATGTDPTGGTGTLDALNIGPGVYFINMPAVLSAGATLTLSGAGEYVIFVNGVVTVGDGAAVALNGGASAANVTWVAGGFAAGAAALAGNLLASGDINLDDTSVLGKLISFNGAINITDAVVVNDAGTAPHVDVSGVSGEAPDANVGDVNPDDDGTAADPYVVTEGDVLTFTVTGFDPDNNGGNVTLSSTGGAGVLDGYSENPVLPQTAPNTVSTLVTFAPPVDSADAGNTVTVTYRALDASGAVCDREVVIFINQLPESGVDAGTVSNQAPFATGSGTAGDPFVVCEGDTFSFDFTGEDPDADGGPTTLDATVNPATGNISFNPGLPLTEGDDSVTTTVTFDTDDTNAGDTFTITFTTTDDNGEQTTEDVVIFVTSLPEFASPFTDGGVDIVTACVGQNLQYDIVASDPDGEDLFLYADGTPVGAEHNPNFLGADTFGPAGEDVLNSATDVDNDGDNSTARTRFSWMPTPVDVGTHVVTYIAEDDFGCIQTTTVVIIVTNPPTVGAVSGTAVGAGDTLTVCPGDPLDVALTGTDEDGDTVELTVTGAPGTATFTPALPVSGAGSANTTLSFTPTALEAGDTFTVTVTATDLDSAATVTDPSIVQCDASASLTFTIQVAEVPVVTVTGTGDTSITGGVINACSGDPVTFRVRATDADAGDQVTLTQSGAPGLATFTPGLPATGNAVETDFVWTAGAAGTSVITFTATDSTGCVTTSTVTINVSAVPTVVVSGVSGAQSGTGTEADPFVVCVGATPAFQFTVTGSDTDGGDQVTLTQSGSPAGANFTTALPTVGNPAATTVTFSPTADQGGETYAVTFTATDNSAANCSASTTVNIRVSSLPVVTATPSVIDVCEGEDIEFRVRATDADPGNVTIGVPTIVSSDVGEGAPQLVLTNTATLPTAGNPVETVVTATAPEVAVDTTFTITYTVTDSDGCTATQVVTVNVQATAPTTISLSQVPDGGIQVGQEVCFVAVVRDNCPTPRPVAGVPVCFQAVGTTGNQTPAGGVHITTDENGEARFCLTPMFPGTLTVTAAIDFNFDCVADAGTTSGTSNITVPSPTQLGVGCYASGRGKVDVSDTLFGQVPVPASFNFDISPRRNNTFRGKVNVVIPAAGVGRRGNIKVQSRRIESMLCAEGPAGRTAVIFGVARVSGHPDVSGNVRFRVDALDAGTPGVPSDRFTITFLTPTGDVLSGPIGGNLAFGRGKNSPSDDIKIRIGTRAR